jgi:mannose-6-phosphate isomerase
MSDSVIQLRCTCNEYPWGRKGHESLAARLCAKTNTDFKIDDSTSYSEMWFGTYPELPSYSIKTGQDLAELLQEQKDKLIGKKVYEKFGADLPFLPKILSIAKALPLQIHPNKKLSEKLNQEDPEKFSDPNHKPEIAVALSKFEAFVGFKPHADIQELMQLDALKQFLPSKLDGVKIGDDEILRQITTNMLKADESTVAATMRMLITDTVQQLGQKHTYIPELAKRLQEQYGKDDNGNLVALICMNFLSLDAGSAIYIPADGIHAYLSGDIIECMARSNNVLNTGFCPRADRDSVDLFAKSLTFKQHDPKEPLLKREKSDKSVDGKTTELRPPMSEFNMLITELKGGETEVVKAIEGPSTLIVTSGHGILKAEGKEFDLPEGAVYFVGHGVEVEITAKGKLGMYRAYAE